MCNPLLGLVVLEPPLLSIYILEYWWQFEVYSLKKLDIQIKRDKYSTIDRVIGL